jgi:heptosyltransferase-1
MKVLIVKTSSLGDIVHTFETVGLLKKFVPDVQIDWVVEAPSKGLLESHPDISKVISIDTRKWRRHPFSKETRQEFSRFKHQLQQKQYDVVFDLQGNSKSGIATWLAKSRKKVGFARGAVAEWPNLLATNERYLPPKGGDIRSDYQWLIRQHFVITESYSYEGVQLALNESDEANFESFIKSLKTLESPAVLVCPGSNWKNKQLSERALKDFLTTLQERHRCHLLFAWGNQEEQRFVQVLSSELKASTVLDKCSLPLLQNIMGKVKLVIAMDSLALHLAATTATTTFSVFGPSLASKYKPMGKQHLAIQGKCPYGKQFDKRCPILRTCETGACMRSIEGNSLFTAFAEQVKIDMLFD